MFIKKLIPLLGLSLLAGCTLTKDKGLKPVLAELPPAKTLQEILQKPSVRAGLAAFDAAKGHKVLAISEDGIWGLAQGTNSIEWAKWSALRDCSAKLDMRNRIHKTSARGCFVYQANAEVFTEPTKKRASVVSKELRNRPIYSFDLGESAMAAFSRHQNQDQNHKAFAVSPGGGWGFAHAFNHPDDAVDHAVRLCDHNISLSDEVCSLYALDGVVVD